MLVRFEDPDTTLSLDGRYRGFMEKLTRRAVRFSEGALPRLPCFCEKR